MSAIGTLFGTISFFVMFELIDNVSNVPFTYPSLRESVLIIARENLGIVTQNCELIPYLTLYENLELSYELNKGPVDEDKKKDMIKQLNELGLYNLENEYPKNLSSGEIKRAAIARSIISKPEVVIMDEPTANLDRKNVTRVLEVLRRCNESGSTVIISSHEGQAIDFADVNINLSDDE